MKTMIAIGLSLLIGCGSDARAQEDPAALDAPDPAEPAEPGSSGGSPSEDDFEDGDAGSAEGIDDAAAAEALARVDAAMAAAKQRGEQERLAVAQQSNELTATSAELDARLASIAGLEGRIDELLGAGKVEREHRRERVDLLANLIATMSPQAAATMLAQMSDAQAQDLLFSVAQTDKRKAAKLIATMPPDRAAAIGQRYLTRDPAKPETLTAAPTSPALQTEPEAPAAPRPAASPEPAPTPTATDPEAGAPTP